MISSDEMQQRILAELEEAGEDYLIALLNSMNDAKQGRPEEVEEFRKAIEQLIDKGLVLMAPDNEPGQRLVKVDAAQSHAMLTERLRPLYFREEDLHWTADPGARSYVVLTPAGRIASEKVLGERGYQWWYYEDDEGIA
jgi:hypothetical protein